jgi:hypothetical protein
MDGDVLYAFGNTYLKVAPRGWLGTRLIRKLLLQGLYTWLDRNLSPQAYEVYQVPMDCFVELASLVEV